MEWKEDVVDGIEKARDLAGKAADYVGQQLHAGVAHVKSMGVPDTDTLLSDYSTYAKATIVERDAMKYSAGENGRTELLQLMKIHELVEGTLRQKETTRQSAPRFSGDAIDAGMGTVEATVNSTIKEQGVVAGVDKLSQQMPTLVQDANFAAAEYRHMEMRRDVEYQTSLSAEAAHLRLQSNVPDHSHVP